MSGVTIKTGITLADIINNDILAYNVTQEDVESENVTNLERVLEKFEKVGKQARGKLMILFMYDEDPREIYEIPEIRKWLRKALRRNPHLFYWVSNNYLQNNAEMLLASLSEDITAVRLGALGNKTLSDWFDEGYSYNELPQNIIHFKLPDSMIEMIEDGLAKYGLFKMNDSRENINAVIKNILECIRRANPDQI